MLPFTIWREAFLNDADLTVARSSYELLSAEPYQQILEPLDLKKFYALDTPRSYLVSLAGIALPPGEGAGIRGCPRAGSGFNRLVQMPGGHTNISIFHNITAWPIRSSKPDATNHTTPHRTHRRTSPRWPGEVGQQHAEPAARMVEPRHHRPDRDVHDLGDLPVPVAMDVGVGTPPSADLPAARRVHGLTGGLAGLLVPGVRPTGHPKETDRRPPSAALSQSVISPLSCSSGRRRALWWLLIQVLCMMRNSHAFKCVPSRNRTETGRRPSAWCPAPGPRRRRGCGSSAVHRRRADPAAGSRRVGTGPSTPRRSPGRRGRNARAQRRAHRRIRRQVVRRTSVDSFCVRFGPPTERWAPGAGTRSAGGLSWCLLSVSRNAQFRQPCGLVRPPSTDVGHRLGTPRRNPHPRRMRGWGGCAGWPAIRTDDRHLQACARLDVRKQDAVGAASAALVDDDSIAGWMR